MSDSFLDGIKCWKMVNNCLFVFSLTFLQVNCDSWFIASDRSSIEENEQRNIINENQTRNHRQFEHFSPNDSENYYLDPPRPMQLGSILTQISEKKSTNPPKNVSQIILNRTINNYNLIRTPKPKTRPKRKVLKRCPTVKRPKRPKFLDSNKTERFLEVFQVVEFENVPCVSSSGLEGVCLHQYECEMSQGLTMGDCADGYGTCCVSQYTCGDQTASEKSWFTNPGFPTPSTERLSCVFTIDKASEDIKQIRLDFLNFELLPPTTGCCEQDQFVVTGQNQNNVIPILCGVNNGQHIYIDVDNSEGPISLSIQTVAPDTRLFAIKISQLAAGDKSLAPKACLQYYLESKGYIESFNYQDKSITPIAKDPSYLNNLNYAVCIERAPDTCSTTYTNAEEISLVNYDLDGYPVIPPGQAGVEIFNCPNDWLLISAARLCGDRLNDGTVVQDFSLNAPVTDMNAGPLVVWFKSDGFYVSRGFKIQYSQNLCSNPV